MSLQGKFLTSLGFALALLELMQQCLVPAKFEILCNVICSKVNPALSDVIQKVKFVTVDENVKVQQDTISS